MFPNAVMLDPKTWDDVLRVHDRGARRARLELTMKKLNIGMIGYGFMGRTHSNAFRKVGHFFDLPYEPVLKTVCARNAERAQAFAAKWGYESVETDWRKRGRIAGHRPHRYRQPQRYARRDRHRRRQGRQDGDVREAARHATPPKAEAMVEAVEAAGVPNMVWYNYRRVPRSRSPSN